MSSLKSVFVPSIFKVNDIWLDILLYITTRQVWVKHQNMFWDYFNNDQSKCCLIKCKLLNWSAQTNTLTRNCQWGSWHWIIGHTVNTVHLDKCKCQMTAHFTSPKTIGHSFTVGFDSLARNQERNWPT